MRYLRWLSGLSPSRSCKEPPKTSVQLMFALRQIFFATTKVSAKEPKLPSNGSCLMNKHVCRRENTTDYRNETIESWQRELEWLRGKTIYRRISMLQHHVTANQGHQAPCCLTMRHEGVSTLQRPQATASGQGINALTEHSRTFCVFITTEPLHQVTVTSKWYLLARSLVDH